MRQKHSVRRWLIHAVLWSGLILCVYAVWSARGVVATGSFRLELRDGVLIVILLYLSWVASVASWRQFVCAYTSALPSWPAAFRQSGMIFIGKYVPGGIFGFMARLYDDGNANKARLLAAGLAEQVVGFAMVVSFGALLYVSAFYGQGLLMVLAIALPFLALISAEVIQYGVSRVPIIFRRMAGADLRAPDRQRLFGAATLSLLQQFVGAFLVALIAARVCNLDATEAMGVAGAFGLAVGAGMLVVVAPGGIGVREGVVIALVAPWIDTMQAVFLAAMLRLLSTAFDLSAGGIAVLLKK